MNPSSRIIVALDTRDIYRAVNLVEDLQMHVTGFKIGYELMHSVLHTLLMPPDRKDVEKKHACVRKLFRLLENRIFWDMKFADIPSTTLSGYVGAAQMKVWMLTVHASAGVRSMKAVADAVCAERKALMGQESIGHAQSPLIIAVTVLTSLDDTDTLTLFGANRREKVLQFAFSARHAGVDGVVCSAADIPILNAYSELCSLKKVVTGIRPTWAHSDDQKSISTPYDAIRAGADYIVIGRPITSPPAEIGSPLNALELVHQEVDRALPRFYES